MFNVDFDLNRIRNFYEENAKTVRMAALIIVVGLSILFFWIHGDQGTHVISEAEAGTEETSESYEDPQYDEQAADQEAPAASSVAYVDISGEVNKPGVYKVTSETRLFEVIDMAGGLTENADPDSLNRAERVTDGQKIIVLSYDESSEIGKSSSSVPDCGLTSDEGDKVNINTADSSELQTIPGIGPAKAQSIIDYREQNGYFTTTEDIMDVTGIGQKTYASIKDYIVV
ncbi:MAG: helix-hairpin-helix domain-containing protein [Firmicutes bacterium]|nr:helix-hairpin-helix domain-containing protein [Bacillota bacterium]MBR6225458.1 helix-hairpin-helix domain-containing protein [Bacillota bacterium]